jgi:ubiquinone/menaquinone biosynthesis C-methylase UbiE
MLPQPDEWSEWLLHRRHGDNCEYEAIVRRVVEGYADRVLDDAHLFPGMTLVDIGAGDGLLAFRAIERIGAPIQVVLTDISEPLLHHAETLAVERNVKAQCRFLRCSAEKLTGIADSSVDAIVARASIAYVSDKKAAFEEFHRVLKPGGRLSIAEPILQDEAFIVRALKKRLDAEAGRPKDALLPLLHRWKSAQYPDTPEKFAKSPLVNFSERDLLNMARSAGFSSIRLQLHISVEPPLSTSWQVYLATSPHPWAPSLGSILENQFSQDERRLFESIVRPNIESGKGVTIDRIAYMNAIH